MMLRKTVIASLKCWAFTLTACSGPNTTPDASCDVSASLGTGTAADFAAVQNGDKAELVFGFQGFLMALFTVELDGGKGDLADLSTFVQIVGTDQEFNQTDRKRPVRYVEGKNGVYIEDHVVFFNNLPISSLVGQTASIEMIARRGGCIGTTRVEVELRDDVDCVDHGIVIPDAGIIDAGITDGAAACD